MKHESEEIQKKILKEITKLAADVIKIVTLNLTSDFSESLFCRDNNLLSGKNISYYYCC